jgi:putative NADPH-quinone reductase
MTHTILEFCGIKVSRLTEFSPVRGSTEEQRQQWIHQAQDLGKR